MSKKQREAYNRKKQLQETGEHADEKVTESDNFQLAGEEA